MRRGDIYQITLVTLGIVATLLFGAFLYREIYPEYAIYQNIYKDLEAFRSTYTGQPAPSFKDGLKQIVILDKNRGPEVVDRCVSCHVALEFEHFSPTKIAYDINGKMQLDENGIPTKIPNEEYVWSKLDQKIAELSDKKTNDALIKEGKNREVKERLRLAQDYTNLKKIKVGDETYEMNKVLIMHPLIGRETRPFEFHPIEDTNCTACHSGNGRGLTTKNAHGPVFDGQYEAEFMGPAPKFLEIDPENDPKFSKVFNHKPGHNLLFQTTPLFVGALIEAKCVQCHKNTENSLHEVYDIANQLAQKKKQKLDDVTQAYENELDALMTLLKLKNNITNEGIEQAYTQLQKKKEDYTLSEKELETLESQDNFLRKYSKNQKLALEIINQKIQAMIGSTDIQKLLGDEKISKKIISDFIQNNRENSNYTGSLFAKANALNLEKSLIQHVTDSEESFQILTRDKKNISAMISDIDLLTKNYKRGQELYLSQACYACHRIAGFSRGGVGPELTEEGKKYPWFIKESIVWPQADLRTSTMPNYKLDHEELEDLMTFLLGQNGKTLEQSDIDYKVAIQQWDLGKRPLPWEKEVVPTKIYDLDYAMEVFALEGCAACHRLKGFQSNVGYTLEKEKPNDSSLLEEKKWFTLLFPEEIQGSQIIEVIEKNKNEIDKRISSDVRKNSILEKIEKGHPKSIESLYSNFKYALRAKNNTKEKKEWKERVHKILMMYVQEYGLGRIVGPRPNWSGIYRSDEWLMEHFKNPSSHVAKSIMPVFPFTNNKFYALTHMLDMLAQKNRDDVRSIWTNQGFNPKTAYDIHCSQCHGEFLQGNGPVSQWIYPIPKNLRNADFLRNLTKEKAYDSILHGVKGTPMPPWGELGKDKPFQNNQPILTKKEIEQIVDWIFSSLSGRSVIRSSQDVPKWKYQPEDVIEEMKKEGQILKGKKEAFSFFPKKYDINISSLIPTLPQSKNSNSKNDVAEFFDIKKDQNGNDAYYIKKEYYTYENLEEAKTIFLRDCSVCHGREADGAGNRAGSMINAKPRMLTNLDWLESRDDLRLLRSIKYGVSGTAMVAWGDQTSAKQRMSLVMYIRSLSEEAMLRDALFKEAYQVYSEAEILIESIRAKNFSKMNEINRELQNVKERKQTFDFQARSGSNTDEDAIEMYKKELELTRTKNQLQESDDLLNALITEIKNERTLMIDLGLMLITQRNDGINPNLFNQILALEKNRFVIKNNDLVIRENNEKKIESVQNELIENINEKIEKLNKEKAIVSGKITSPENSITLQEIDRKLKSLDELKRKIISTLARSKKIIQKQKQIILKYQNKL